MEDMLKVYLSASSKSDNEKRKVRKAVTDFMTVLNEHGRTWPEGEDYEAYRHKLEAEGKSDGVIRDSVSRVRKFFDSQVNDKALYSDFSEAHEVTAPMQEPLISEAFGRRDDMKGAKTRRFSLLITPAMYEALEWLSQYDRCSVAKVILNACTEYTAQRREDIDYITEQMNILKRGIEQREAGKV